MYEMSGLMSKSCNRFLWFMILGFTEHYLHERIDNTKYSQYVTNAMDEAANYNSTEQDFQDEQQQDVKLNRAGHITFSTE